MCTFHFVISWHQHNLASGQSWLKPRAVTEKLRKEAENYKRRKMLVFLFLGPFAFLIYRDNPPMVYFHLAFAYANIAIITGGSYLVGADYNDLNSPDTKTRLNISKITRTTGQSVFVAGNAMLLAIILVTMRNNRRNGDSRGKKGTVHPTLWLLFIAWFPLIVRGIFGILQASVFSVSCSQ
jgi:hypothetical protein